MTPLQINIAIAEACGWCWYRLPKKAIHGPRDYRCLFLPAVHEYEGQSPRWLVRADGSESICNWKFMQEEGLVRDYCNDLDAIHEAESSLSNMKYIDYVSALHFEVFNVEPSDKCNIVCSFRMVHANAQQRCEAFLKTIKKWIE